MSPSLPTLVFHLPAIDSTILHGGQLSQRIEVSLFPGSVKQKMAPEDIEVGRTAAIKRIKLSTAAILAKWQNCGQWIDTPSNCGGVYFQVRREKRRAMILPD
jgi:hypothetical protein